jgi:transcriptional regulator with GAF, ATPase, and Fis domain
MKRSSENNGARLSGNGAARLKATNGKLFGKGGAAELLGLKPTTLASRLKRLDIELEDGNKG